MGIMSLNCADNLFVELSVAHADSLKTLNVQGCHLEVLSVDSCVNLRNLYCGYNRISVLRLIDVPALETLNIDNNNIVQFYVTGQPDLYYFSAAAII